MLTDRQDAYGHLLLAHLEHGGGYEIIEREDGYFDISSGPDPYFAPFKDWPESQRHALVYAQGRVLDIGAGAGRVSLELQTRGHEVLAIDNSPLAIEVCRQRGVREAVVSPITRLSRRFGKFDTIIMFGNNFGLFGNLRRARWLLRRFHAMTGPQACILAESNDPHRTENPFHLAYQESNRQRGRLPGQIKIRVRFQKYKSPWFDYLLVSPDEMRSILVGTGWILETVFESKGSPYVAKISKQPASGE